MIIATQGIFIPEKSTIWVRTAICGILTSGFLIARAGLGNKWSNQN